MAWFVFLFFLLSVADFVLGFVVLFAGRGGDVGTAAVHLSLGAVIFILTSIWWKVDNLLDQWEAKARGIVPPPAGRPEGPGPQVAAGAPQA